MALVLAGCAHDPSVSQYTGADAGTLVVSIGLAPGTTYQSFAIYLRRMDGDDDQRVWWGADNPFDTRKAEYTSGGTGIVEVRKLPPGDYEIYNFLIDQLEGLTAENWRSREDFSLPFHITSGTTTYIGNFALAGLTGKNLFGRAVPAGGEWIVTNQSARDLAIARAKDPALPPARIAVVNADAANNPLIRSH
jgi:hypothetical protein